MSLEVGIHINAVLKRTIALTNKVEDRIFPIATTVATKFPFVVYQRENIEPKDTKDLYDDEVVIVTVYVFSDNYGESVDVAVCCRKALSGYGGEYDDFIVKNCKMTNAIEAYADQTFVQKLFFELTTEDK